MRGELHMLIDANENRTDLTKVPEQVSFQKLSTVLCAGACKQWKDPQRIHTIPGARGKQGQGVSLCQICNIPDFSNGVILDCVFSSACLLPAFGWVLCLQHQSLVPASWLHFLLKPSLSLLPHESFCSQILQLFTPMEDKRQIRDCLLPAASSQQSLTRVMPCK